MVDGIIMYMINLDPNFPMQEIILIASSLEKSGILTPGYVPPEVGLLDVLAIHYAQDVENTEIFVLPDRNIVTRIAKIAREGISPTVDQPTQWSVELMAYAQCLNIQFEPSIAFHELAHTTDNETAYEEIRWFRKGDKVQPQAWVDIALRRRSHLDECEAGLEENRNLAYPLNRWRLNYLVALKIAELELLRVEPIKRAITLFDWMFDEFFVAGPAAIFATMYFAPQAPRRNMLKRLRSADRKRALEGIRNAAWDMTHLSEFIRQVINGRESGRCYILATADTALASLAPLLMTDVDEGQYADVLSIRLQEWWPTEDAQVVASNLSARAALAAKRPPPTWSDQNVDILSVWIQEAEEKIRLWKQ